MITIRYANNNDIESIVRIHSDAFKGFFLTSLGADFLKFYYSCFVKSKETIIMVAEENGEIYGFSASTKKSKGFNSRLIKHNFFSFGILSIKLLLKTPSALIRLIKNMTKKVRILRIMKIMLNYILLESVSLLKVWGLVKGY